MTLPDNFLVRWENLTEREQVLVSGVVQDCAAAHREWLESVDYRRIGFSNFLLARYGLERKL